MSAWVVLLEDPRSPTALAWRGHEWPYHGIETTIAVPPGGVVRLHALDKLTGRADLRVLWPDGRYAVGFAAGPAPAGIGARTFLAITRRDWRSPADDLPSGAALAAYVRARELSGR